MITPQLVEYAKRQIENGLSPENIETILIKNGWKREDVDEVLKSLNHPVSSPVSPTLAEVKAPELSDAVSLKPPFWTKQKMLFVFCALMLGVLTGGYFAYGYYKELPTVVLPKVAKNMTAIKTVHYDAKLSFSLKSSMDLADEESSVKTPEISYSISLDGQSDLENKRSNTTASFELGGIGSQENSGKGSLEIRSIERVLYLRLLGLPDFGSVKTDSIQNKWIKIDPAEIAKEMEALGVASSSSQFQPKEEQIKQMYEIAKKEILALSKKAINTFLVQKFVKFDALVGAYSKEIEGLVYPKFPFGADQVTAVFLKNSDVKWQGELSLEGQKVGWIQGYSYDKYLRYKVQKTELSRRDHGFSQLKSERLDFYLDAAEDIKRELQRESLKSEPTPYRTEPLMKLSLYLVFTNNDRGKRLAKIFDERMALLIQSGELKALYDKAKYIDYPF